MFPNFMNPSAAGIPNGNFVNPYFERLQAMTQPQVQPYQITRVNGRNGAEAFQMPPNSNTLLLDESMPLVWLVQSDGAGYKTCTPYTISPYQAQPEPDYNSLNQRITRLETMINESYHANAEPAVKPGGTDTNVGIKPHTDDSAVPAVPPANGG